MSSYTSTPDADADARKSTGQKVPVPSKNYNPVSTSAGMGHLEAGVPILSNPASQTPALDVGRWGKVLCRVTIPSEHTHHEWNFGMTNSTICLWTDDAENCKLFPRQMIQMVDLVDTDEVVVKVSKVSYYMRKILGTLLFIGILVALDELFVTLYGSGVLQEILPTDMYALLASYTSPWWLLVLVPLVPISWCVVGCCVPTPYADVFKGSKLTLVTGATTTTFRMQDSDIPEIQDFLDDPSGVGSGVPKFNRR
ncbi:hypothetical protein AB1Y20_022619 [Prymnesium parvum]|uniref:Uncharacterized protein n=1 Tax=Prymnesium parvum TaxID=97485 RepID=A0AB34JK58_PRYPA|mmetsp:Transcript_33677/g.77234  ORF Transcript_33677/g.77234 Transcript_33677/m.77234 type:complete len:253 (+) Transcript_33677:41-799(+)|eukprot:CAMPEP_0113274482 /NCGR_PEP_ID=MMETSP0008_2-20120614/24429_1 /TAXON_ID=97485 /ORGANISM="Prymnesium parvum" /LENGTH=252 /DNA_ID=CAMNT_0000124111 /DNA_START=9 /DNA_END=767 /DNA_ORIENTATION=- /assembly_acc=CAM_ASM_000153